MDRQITPEQFKRLLDRIIVVLYTSVAALRRALNRRIPAELRALDDELEGAKNRVLAKRENLNTELHATSLSIDAISPDLANLATSLTSEMNNVETSLKLELDDVVASATSLIDQPLTFLQVIHQLIGSVTAMLNAMRQLLQQLH